MSKARVCVLDAGPLIHLDQLGVVYLIGELGTVFCPEEVAAEAETHRPGVMQRCSSVSIMKTPKFEVSQIPLGAILQKGELAALAWAQTFGAELFVSDDTDAREAAKIMKIAVTGTLGVFQFVVREGIIDAVDACALMELIPAQSTLHVHPMLLKSAIASLR